MLSDGNGLAAIVQADLLGIARWHVEAVREYKATQLGMPRERVLLFATHTHSGPGMVRVRGCEVAAHASRWEVIDRINSTLIRAKENPSPAWLAFASALIRLGATGVKKLRMADPWICA